MKTNMIISIIFILFIIAAFAIGISKNDNEQIRYELIPNSKIPETLNTIFNKVENNYKLIKTWEGKVISEIDYIYEGKAAEKMFKSSTLGIGEVPKSIINSIETVIEFSLDAENEYVFTYNYPAKPSEYKDFDTGKDLGAKGVSGEARSILTKEYYIKSRADRRRNNEVTSRKAVKQSLENCPSCQSQPVFDPREGFNIDSSVKTLQHVLEQIKKSGKWEIHGQSLTVEEQKNEKGIIKYRIVIPGKITEGSLIFTTMVFSSEKDFNIISFQVTDTNDRIFQYGEWDYELRDGVHLPKETTYQNYTNKDGNLSYNKKLTFENLRINQSIPPETFTYKNLGLKENDKFIDKIENKEYRYEEATKTLELIKAKKKPAEPNQ